MDDPNERKTEETGQSAAPLSGTPEPGRPRSELKTRIITGTVYFLVICLFFALKLFVWTPYTRNGEAQFMHIGTILFDVLVLTFAAIGTVEMLRAFREKIYKPLRAVVLVFSLATLVGYCVSDFIFVEVFGISLPDNLAGVLSAQGRNYSLYITIGILMAGVATLCSFLVFAHSKVTLEGIGYAFLCFLYPTLFLVTISICNHFEKYSELAILLVFVISPCADTFAFLFGKLFGKKLPAKMAPNISPKKTMIGGLGGLLGGAIGAVIIFFACYGLTFLDDAGVIASLGWDLEIDALNLIFFISLGILTAAFSQFGDLVESAIKRKLGIKDMGKLLPGHGGILDRIDSTLYAGLVVSLAMVARIMIVG